MCELQLTVGIMSCTALFTTLCVKGGTHPRIRQVEGGGDGGDMVPRDHRMDSLGTAKDTRFLGLLEHGV